MAATVRTVAGIERVYVDADELEQLATLLRQRADRASRIGTELSDAYRDGLMAAADELGELVADVGETL